MSRFVLGLGALCALICIGGLHAQHSHHDGHDLFRRARPRPNAVHTLHRNVAGHSIHATTNNRSKVRSMHAVSRGRRVNPIKMVKAARKHHAGLGRNGEFHYVSTDEDTGGCQTVQWIGFMFNLGNKIFVFWFPVSIVSVDPSACEDYP